MLIFGLITLKKLLCPDQENERQDIYHSSEKKITSAKP